MNSPGQIGGTNNLCPAASTVIGLSLGIGTAVVETLSAPLISWHFPVLIGIASVAILCPVADQEDALLYEESFTKADALCSSLRGILLAGFGYFVGGFICLIMYF